MLRITCPRCKKNNDFNDDEKIPDLCEGCGYLISDIAPEEIHDNNSDAKMMKNACEVDSKTETVRSIDDIRNGFEFTSDEYSWKVVLQDPNGKRYSFSLPNELGWRDFSSDDSDRAISETHILVDYAKEGLRVTDESTYCATWTGNTSDCLEKDGHRLRHTSVVVDVGDYIRLGNTRFQVVEVGHA